MTMRAHAWSNAADSESSSLATAGSTPPSSSSLLFRFLFRSAAAAAGSNATAALLTGMGRDGAEGLLELRKAGSFTIAQDENTSVVWGMPRCAVELGAAEFVAPLGEVSSALLKPKSLRARV